MEKGKLINNRIKSLNFNPYENNKKSKFNFDSEPVDFKKKRVLFVSQKGYGGSLYHCMDLISTVNKYVDCYLLETGTSELSLYKYVEGNFDDEIDEKTFRQNLVLIKGLKINKEYSLLNISIKEYKSLYTNFIEDLDIELIHIIHLIKGTFDIPIIANELDIPVVLSLHDFYYICPSYNLLNEKHEYCGGYCAPLENNEIPQCTVDNELNLLPARTIVKNWRKAVSIMFNNISAFVAPYSTVREKYIEFYPKIDDGRLVVIEHGRNIKTPDSIEEKLSEFKKDEPIRILIPGNLSYAKGFLNIMNIKKFDVENKLEFHFIGSLDKNNELNSCGTYHGSYERKDFSKKVDEIKPHFIGILSSCPEVFSYTLTEAWSCGIPVLSYDFGAQGKRIKLNGGGFLINNDASIAYNEILKIAENKELYNEEAKKIKNIKITSIHEMAYEYLVLYDELLNV